MTWSSEHGCVLCAAPPIASAWHLLVRWLGDFLSIRPPRILLKRNLCNTPSQCTVPLVVDGAHVYILFYVADSEAEDGAAGGNFGNHLLDGVSITGYKCSVVHIHKKDHRREPARQCSVETLVHGTQKARGERAALFDPPFLTVHVLLAIRREEALCVIICMAQGGHHGRRNPT